MTRLGSDVFVAASSEAVTFELDFRMAPGGNPLTLGGTRRGQRPIGTRWPTAAERRAELASAYVRRGHADLGRPCRGIARAWSRRAALRHCPTLGPQKRLAGSYKTV